jgi:hypothetical protein
MDAKAQLLAAARAGGAAAVRDLQAAGGPRETVLVRYHSLGALQYQLTDQNYHSVEAVREGAFIRLSAPCGYGLDSVVSNFSLEVAP